MSGGSEIAALLLAAGRSTRMGSINKLLAPLDGKPLVRLVAETVLRSRVSGLHVVTGHEADRIEAALAGLEIRIHHNPDHREGLASSLRCGIAGLPNTAAGAVICLGDMPFVGPEVIDALIEAFDPKGGKSLCIPTAQGQRGNPVLLGRKHFAALQKLSGDRGARGLIAARPEAVREVPVESDDILRDIDRQEDLARAAEEI